jgi:hypothetical protein
MICGSRVVEETGYLIQPQIRIAEEIVENRGLLKEGQGKGAKIGSRKRENCG